MTNLFADETFDLVSHNDPDKHWIGEALPVPSLSEVATVSGTATAVGDSPFPARADHTHAMDPNAVYTFAGLRGAWVTLTDDQAAFTQFNPAGLQFGTFVLSCNASGGPHAFIAFRTGESASPFCLAIATTGVVPLAVGIGSLAGTTGVDGNVTVRAYNLDPPSFGRIYIENRSSATRAFGIQFLNLATSSRIPDITWTLMP